MPQDPLQDLIPVPQDSSQDLTPVPQDPSRDLLTPVLQGSTPVSQDPIPGTESIYFHASLSNEFLDFL